MTLSTLNSRALLRKWKLYYNGLWNPKNVEDKDFMIFIKTYYINLDIVKMYETNSHSPIVNEIYFFQKNNECIFSYITNLNILTLNQNISKLFVNNDDLELKYNKSNLLINFLKSIMFYHYRII